MNFQLFDERGYYGVRFREERWICPPDDPKYLDLLFIGTPASPPVIGLTFMEPYGDERFLRLIGSRKEELPDLVRYGRHPSLWEWTEFTFIPGLYRFPKDKDISPLPLPA